MVLGSGKRSEDLRLMFGAGTAEAGFVGVALARPDRSPLSFTGKLLFRHRRLFRNDQTLELTLWRRKLTGFVIGYPICTKGYIGADAVLVDSVAKAIHYLEDLCAFPPPIDPPPKPSLDVLLLVQQIAHLNQVFSSMVGEALADWVTLDQTTHINPIKQQARS